MKTQNPVQSGLVLVVALIVVVLGMSPALAQAGERSHHGKAGHHSSYYRHGEHGYSRPPHLRHGHEAPAHVVRHEVVYEAHQPLHHDIVHARPYVSLSIPLLLFLH